MNPREFLSGIRTIAVHDGTFHADDVFAVAILYLLKSDLEIVRTRDEEMLSRADMRIDVGGKHSIATGDFDHHMPKGCGSRKNGIPYAACGLIWKHFGTLLCPSETAWDHIDRQLIQAIDAVDSGYSFGEDKNPHKHYTI
ncbi:MAG: MYG1 family protein, partial [Spirochaetota bacterium]